MSSLANLAVAGVDLPGSGVGSDWAGTGAGADLAGDEVAGPRTGVITLSASLFFSLASQESDVDKTGVVIGAADGTGVVVCAGLVNLKIGDRR